jgi:hypothetical protein
MATNVLRNNVAVSMRDKDIEISVTPQSWTTYFRRADEAIGIYQTLQNRRFRRVR